MAAPAEPGEDLVGRVGCGEAYKVVLGAEGSGVLCVCVVGLEGLVE
ncbi:hypothetical protein [Streptomyces yaizuensis]|uniref:Uncharacterized protein n=1 Tax=Streptomyces yaizuensis TaxID=2989713 RepID=A0ABQ5NY25_9ACTN|nr:hypothetical protein [Streptomyces sp. YSPA8]GLF95262.1 hypothetical protein SYYSPA8_13215 [Streptomyces sp. YSPA8]